MTNRWTLIAVGIGAAILGMLLQSPGPIGQAIWPMAEGTPAPEGTNLALLMVMGGIEAIAFGLGAAFLVAAWPWVKRAGAGTKALSWMVYLSVAWVLMNWVPHTALHMNHGNLLSPADFGGLVAIEYGFHFTLILAGTALAVYAVRSAASAPRKDGRATPATAAKKAA